jgi:hypothetical protein
LPVVPKTVIMPPVVAILPALSPQRYVPLDDSPGYLRMT